VGRGPDVAIAASFAPATQAIRVEDGYRVSGQRSAFTSGVAVIVGGLTHEWLRRNGSSS
jgi:hypothetical protein